jgi:hypothetical protein
VAWLNSDDVYYSNNVINQVVEYFKENPQMDVVYGDVGVISEDGTLLRLFLLPPFDPERILRQNLISQPAVFIHGRVVEKEKLDIHQVGLDYEYWLRLVTQGYRFSHINSIFACDRHYPERISVTQKGLIESQIRDAKRRLGLSQPTKNLSYYIDRLFQAVCRIRGLLRLFQMFLVRDRQNIVFPMNIDSYPKLFWRQLTKAIGSKY